MKKLTELKKTERKKPSPSIKGKQALVGGLVVLVAVAGYYRYAINNEPKPQITAQEEAIPVMSVSATSSKSYFATARQDRDSARSESENLLEQITQDDETTADAKAEAREKLKLSAENIKTEGEIESLVKAKGYEECIAFIDEEEIRIIVKSEKLDEDKVSQLMEIAVSKTNFKPSEIIISCHK